MSCLIPTKPGGSLSGPPPTIGTTFGFPGDSAPVGEVYVYFHALDLHSWFETAVAKDSIQHRCFHSFSSLMAAVMDTKPAILWLDRAETLLSLLTWFPDLGSSCSVVLMRDQLPAGFHKLHSIRVYSAADPHQLSS